MGFKEVERTHWSMAHWLGKKVQGEAYRDNEKYRENQYLRYITSTLTMPTSTRQGYMAKTWHNPYTAKRQSNEKIFAFERLWNGTRRNRHGYIDLREEVIALKGTICAYKARLRSKGRSLHPSEVEIDHVTPRKRFKDTTEADRMKHLQPICTSCHKSEDQD